MRMINWFCLLIGAFIGWLFGWLIDVFFCCRRRVTELSRLRTQLKHCTEDCQALRAQILDFKDAGISLNEANVAHAPAKERLAGPDEGQPAAGASDLATRGSQFDFAATPPAPPGVIAAPDDLTAIEGIGPKIKALLNDAGITTFAQLAETSPDDLRSILRAAGRRFSLADPQTWPEQARLARDGDWDAFEALTRELKGGRIR